MQRFIPTKLAPMPRLLATFLVALAPLACAGTREEPPAPPPPPVDPAAFSGTARAPAPEVDLNANLDAANVWDEAGAADNKESATPPPVAPVAVPDGGSDAQAIARKPKRGAN